MIKNYPMDNKASIKHDNIRPIQNVHSSLRWWHLDLFDMISVDIIERYDFFGIAVSFILLFDI